MILFDKAYFKDCNTEPVEQQSSIQEPAQTSNEPQVQQTMSSPKSVSARSYSCRRSRCGHGLSCDKGIFRHDPESTR